MCSNHTFTSSYENKIWIIIISKTMSKAYNYLVVLESAEMNVEVQDLLLVFESDSIEYDFFPTMSKQTYLHKCLNDQYSLKYYL